MACVIAVVLAVVVGGVTRLSESGLSITAWNPVSGILPPMNAAAWNAAYQDFLRIPQAQTVHQGITLGGFKLIYWWEWFHRLLARGVGLVFAVPYVVLFARRRIPEGYRARLAALPVLTLAQGALGWYMVQSGLAVRTSVSAYRLTAHLALALGILAIATWTYLELGPRVAGTRASRAWRGAMAAAAVLIACTILSGGFVAGLRAGRIFNTFPLMGGAIIPPGYGQLSPWWVNAFENPIAAQFHHRVLALVSAAFALILAWRAGTASLAPQARRAVRVLCAVVLVQAVIGITTLLLVVPITVGVLHQFLGVMALTAAIVAAQRVWSAERGSNAT
jgi:cytochrome c oxidase assembly protein subunit 15